MQGFYTLHLYLDKPRANCTPGRGDIWILEALTSVGKSIELHILKILRPVRDDSLLLRLTGAKLHSEKVV